MDLPKLALGPNLLSDINSALGKEWLVTNGLGGYSSSTVLGINTRKYHGLLVAALNPPINRWILLTKPLAQTSFMMLCTLKATVISLVLF